MLVRHAIFPVAGLGTRSLPATKAMPKEMLPVVDKPLDPVRGGRSAARRECGKLVFVTGSGKRAYRGSLRQSSWELERGGSRRPETSPEMLEAVRKVEPDDMGCNYMRQSQALGLGHAVLCARAAVGNHPFAVHLAGDRINEPPSLKQMSEVDYARGVDSSRCRKSRTNRRAATAPSDACERRAPRRRPPHRPKPAPAVAPSRLAVAAATSPPRVSSTRSPPQRGAGGEIQLTDGIAAGCAGGGVGGTGSRASATMWKQGGVPGRPTSSSRWRNPELGPEFRAWLRSLEL